MIQWKCLKCACTEAFFHSPFGRYQRGSVNCNVLFRKEQFLQSIPQCVMLSMHRRRTFRFKLQILVDFQFSWSNDLATDGCDYFAAKIDEVAGKMWIFVTFIHIGNGAHSLIPIVKLALQKHFLKDEMENALGYE